MTRFPSTTYHYLLLLRLKFVVTAWVGIVNISETVAHGTTSFMPPSLRWKSASFRALLLPRKAHEPSSIREHSASAVFLRATHIDEGAVEGRESQDFHHTFWATARTEDEIKEFAFNAVFSPSQNEENLQSERSVEVLNVEPPLIVVHGFLEGGMCDEIMLAAETKQDGGFSRSTTGNTQDMDDIRTSETTWLHDSHCAAPLRLFASRASRLCGLPCGCQENLQVVRYGPTQKFDLHTDHLDSFNELECRGRLGTCLLYLNSAELVLEEKQVVDDRFDEKESRSTTAPSFTGGETCFPEFNVSIMPRRGSCVFFWNTIERPGADNYDPLMDLSVDLRLRHAGLPVTSGEKWVCNRWIHPIEIGAGVRGA